MMPFRVFFCFCRDLVSETWIFKRPVTKQNSATKVNKACSESKNTTSFF